MANFTSATTKTINVAGTPFVYREFGTSGSVPLIFLHHLTAVLEDWDPAFLDDIAAAHRVIIFDNRGVGGSEGKTPASIQEMADDAIALIEALGLEKVDLFGFSLGGFVAQAIIQTRPDLIRRMILTGTGPAGGRGISRVGEILGSAIAEATETGLHPKHILFFTRTPSGRASADAYLSRLAIRTENRDAGIADESIGSQLAAITAWGEGAPTALEAIEQPVLIANGDDDVMVPTAGSFELARRIRNSTLSIFPNAGHAGVFQHRAAFVPQVLAFLNE